MKRQLWTLILFLFQYFFFISIPTLSGEKVSVVFQMCWRLITGNEEAEEVRGRDK